MVRSGDLSAVWCEDAEFFTVEFHGPTALMNHVVVVIAQEYEILHIGATTVSPMNDVMGIAPPGWSPTAGISTPLIAHDECLPGRRGDGAAGPADVDRQSAGAGDNPRHHAVAQQALHIAAVQCPGELAVQPAERVAGEGLPVNDHGNRSAGAPRSVRPGVA